MDLWFFIMVQRKKFILGVEVEVKTHVANLLQPNKAKILVLGCMPFYDMCLARVSIKNPWEAVVRSK